MARPATEHHAGCDSGRVEIAANWFRINRDGCPRPIVPTLQAAFGLTAGEACEVIRRAADAVRS